MKKVLCLILSLAMLLPVLASCSGITGNEKDSDTESTPADTDTTPETDADTEPEVEEVTIIENGELLYKLIRYDESGEGEKLALSALFNAINEKFGALPSAGTDWLRTELHKGEIVDESPEILIGETNRCESKEVYMSLSAGEYAIRMMGNKLVIVGKTVYLTQRAVEVFIEEYVKPSDGKTLSVPSNLSLVGSSLGDTAASTKPAVKVEEVTVVGDRISVSAQQWLANELEFTSDKEYTDPVYTVDMDVVFYNEATGTALSVPAFWDGGKSWKVRFALTELGEWSFYTKCTDTENAGLHHRGGTATCTAYTGDLDIYKHGFIKTEPGKQYFMYDDGTPFFYLGDTHWTLAIEDIDGYGSPETQKLAGISQELAEQYGVTSMFKYIMDYRAEQGYTVIQSQPLDWWHVIDQNWFEDGAENIFKLGVNDVILEKFQKYDRYFEYIAEKGFVHSNSQFSYPTSFMGVYFAGGITDEQVEKLCRYWVARYSAYPVMWATTQEGDNDYYGVDRGDCEATPETNPWLLVIDYIHKYDAYDHPSTCHQEHTMFTCVTNSAFGPKESHKWYAAQYNNSIILPLNWKSFKEYWGNPGGKPVVNYEGRYDHFWTGTDGARIQGWLAFMNGQVGYGYGVQPIWSIFWAQNGIANYETSTGSDEHGVFNMGMNWLEGLFSEGGQQVADMKKYLSRYEWWRLIPCFDGSYFYKPGKTKYSVTTIENELYLGYFYATGKNNEDLGTLLGMENAEYEVQWFDPRTGEYKDAFKVTITDGTYKLPETPGDGDWVISVKLVK